MIPVSAVSSVNVKPLHKRVFAREIAAAKLQAGNQTATELVVPVYDIANSPASEDNLVDDDKEEPKAKEAVYATWHYSTVTLLNGLKWVDITVTVGISLLYDLMLTRQDKISFR